MAGIYWVEGMTCQGCVEALTRAIKHRAPTAAVTIDLGSGRLEVDDRTSEADLRAAVGAAGFTLRAAA